MHNPGEEECMIHIRGLPLPYTVMLPDCFTGFLHHFQSFTANYGRFMYTGANAHFTPVYHVETTRPFISPPSHASHKFPVNFPKFMGFKQNPVKNDVVNVVHIAVS